MAVRDHPDYDSVRLLAHNLNDLAGDIFERAKECEDIAIQAAMESIAGVLPMMAQSLASLLNKDDR